jgi:hypothetical protein
MVGLAEAARGDILVLDRETVVVTVGQTSVQNWG